MEEILHSTMLEYDKSTFVIDLIKHASGEHYIKIQQTIKNDTIKYEVKINPSILNDMVLVLQSFENEILKSTLSLGKRYFSEDKQKELIKRYFKGVSIEDLALQFNCPKRIIEQIFFNKGIDVVNNNPPKKSNNFKRKRRT